MFFYTMNLGIRSVEAVAGRPGSIALHDDFNVIVKCHKMDCFSFCRELYFFPKPFYSMRIITLQLKKEQF